MITIPSHVRSGKVIPAYQRRSRRQGSVQYDSVIAVRMPQELKAWYDREAADRGISISELMRTAMLDMMERELALVGAHVAERRANANASRAHRPKNHGEAR